MQKRSLGELIEYNDNRFNPKVLANEPGYRMVLLCLRASQSVPEHATQGKVTVYVIHGSITFYEANNPCELHTGEVVSVEPGALHHLEAHEDSALLVLATGTANSAVDRSEEIDVREVPRTQRHPLIFSKFDSLAVGASLRLLNDHDPVPLNRQFEDMRPGQFAWDYIERGPAIFRIRIRRIAAARPEDAPLKTPSETVTIKAPDARL